MSQYLSRIFELLVFPPGVFIVLLVLSVLFIKKLKLLKALLLLQILMIYVLSTPITVHFLFQYLESVPALTIQQIKNNKVDEKVDAIVILAGGITAYQREYHGSDVNYFSLLRLRYGAWLYRRTGLPIIVSGGVERSGITEAELMARVLRSEYAIRDNIFIEKQSRNTYDNALYSHEIMQQQGFKSIYLVTNAFHIPRALLSFQKDNITIIPAPTKFYHGILNYNLGDFLPNSNAMRGTYLALHEIVGYYWYQLKLQKL